MGLATTPQTRGGLQETYTKEKLYSGEDSLLSNSYFTANSLLYTIIPTMLFFTTFVLSFISAALSCGPPSRRDNTNATSPYPFLEGDSDLPADSSTTGYFINHFSLNTNNLTRSIDFYTRIFGLRHMFTYHLTRHMSVTYLGHSQGGRNGSGYQTIAELVRDKQNSAGLIEFVYFNTTSIGGEPIPGPDKRTSTFSHVGVIVPDPAATQKRLEEYGVTIYKKLAEPMPKDGPLGSPFGLGDATYLSPEAFEEIQEQMTLLNQLNIFAADPDSNMLEIQPFHEPHFFG
jgi:lactoylglutathione lyase